MSESRDLRLIYQRIYLLSKDFRADQEMKLGKDASEDAEFHEYLLSNNQPDQESLLRAAAKAFNCMGKPTTLMITLVPMCMKSR